MSYVPASSINPGTPNVANNKKESSTTIKKSPAPSQPASSASFSSVMSGHQATQLPQQVPRTPIVSNNHSKTRASTTDKPTATSAINKQLPFKLIPVLPPDKSNRIHLAHSENKDGRIKSNTKAVTKLDLRL